MKNLHGSILYFAYRADLRREIFLKHFTQADWLGLAKLGDYRPAFSDRKVATIRYQVGAAVYGGLWLVPAGALAGLDEVGGVAAGHSVRVTHRIVSPAGPSAEAMLHVGSRAGFGGAPDPGYLSEMIAGARESQAPEAYLNQLRALGEGAGGGGARQDSR